MRGESAFKPGGGVRISCARDPRGFGSTTPLRSKTAAWSSGVPYTRREVGGRPHGVGRGAPGLRSHREVRRRSGARSLTSRRVAGAPAREGPDVPARRSGRAVSENRTPPTARRADAPHRHPGPACRRTPRACREAACRTFSADAWTSTKPRDGCRTFSVDARTSIEPRGGCRTFSVVAWTSIEACGGCRTLSAVASVCLPARVGS